MAYVYQAGVFTSIAINIGLADKQLQDQLLLVAGTAASYTKTSRDYVATSLDSNSTNTNTNNNTNTSTSTNTNNNNSNSTNYNYGSTGSSDRAFGCLASSSYLGSLGAVLVNNSTGPLNKVTITYTGEKMIQHSCQ